MPTIEERCSKPLITFPITTPVATTEEVQLTWDIIDKSTDNYAKLIQEYDISEIVKSFIHRYGKNKKFATLPRPGNIDLSDKTLGFNSFYSLLESMKSKDLSSSDLAQQLEEAAQPITDYLLSGKHPSASKQFSGWQSTFSRNKSVKKTLVGIISIDLPTPYYTPKNATLKYKCSGTQHYVAFAYDPLINKLYIFDSASKNPNKDQSEIIHILKFAFESLTKTKSALQIEGLVFRNILQPGAGDKKEEDERSYNNQNVFCHTWSLWFIMVFINFYECDKSKICDPALKFIQSLSHRSNMYNLVMIKRFAGWLSVFLEDPPEPQQYEKKFAIKAYNRAIENNDYKRLQEVLAIYSLAKDPYVGLNYIFNANLKQYISIEYVCRLRKIKMEIDILDTLETINMNEYIEKSQQIRCPQEKILNPTTKRCIKVFRKY